MNFVSSLLLKLPQKSILELTLNRGNLVIPSIAFVSNVSVSVVHSSGITYFYRGSQQGPDLPSHVHLQCRFHKMLT
jgi:hypothetical protein